MPTYHHRYRHNMTHPITMHTAEIIRIIRMDVRMHMYCRVSVVTYGYGTNINPIPANMIPRPK